jgi:aminoglycoside phosphotransferase (APT) family kinase protein
LSYCSRGMSNIGQITDDLVCRQILTGNQIEVAPLPGGVSSDIYLIDDGVQRIVVKQALNRLKVRDLWRVDVARNLTEQQFIRCISEFLPQATPRLVHHNNELNYFAMEYLEGYRNWKSILLAGEAEPSLARQAGKLLGTIHQHTRGDVALLELFDTTRNFHALRTEPYLLTAASRHPALRNQIVDEANRLDTTRLCLIHGDYSPKNIMVGPGRMVLLDCEVAWYGEPAFDLAFLFNHFLLKALFHRNPCFLSLTSTAWHEYQSCFGEPGPGLEVRTGRLLLMLMLARIDGKSPVEYLTDEQSKQAVRDFVYKMLPRQRFGLDEICSQWRQSIDNLMS